MIDRALLKDFLFKSKPKGGGIEKRLIPNINLYSGYQGSYSYHSNRGLVKIEKKGTKDDFVVSLKGVVARVNKAKDIIKVLRRNGVKDYFINIGLKGIEQALTKARAS